MNNKNFLEILKDEFREKFHYFFINKKRESNKNVDSENKFIEWELNPLLEDLENLKYLFGIDFFYNENLNREHIEIKKIIAKEIVIKLVEIENTRVVEYQKYLATQKSKNRGSRPVKLLEQDLKKVENFEKLLKEYVEPSIFITRQGISFDKRIKDVFEVINLIKNDLKTMNDENQTSYISWEHYYTNGKKIDTKNSRENSEVKAKENKLIEYYKSICMKFKIKIKLADLNISLEFLKIEAYKRIKENLK
ncbi:hypothetical protein ACN9JV_04135 [Aliarcobacter butzleri]|uniref:hypothetical protein n=1 Tax=Aliarcobacter butzleri TaxID=28197 RepID=UPI00125EB1D7|nr:hypothetical protein [Aliarcobacter butzleri]